MPPLPPHIFAMLFFFALSLMFDGYERRLPLVARFFAFAIPLFSALRCATRLRPAFITAAIYFARVFSPGGVACFSLLRHPGAKERQRVVQWQQREASRALPVSAGRRR